MGCGHGGHGCAPWYGGPHGRGWYGPEDWYAEADWASRPGYRRHRRPDDETRTDTLEARLEALRDEVGRVEAELMNLRRSGEAVAEQT